MKLALAKVFGCKTPACLGSVVVLFHEFHVSPGKTGRRKSFGVAV